MDSALSERIFTNQAVTHAVTNSYRLYYSSGVSKGLIIWATTSSKDVVFVGHFSRFRHNTNITDISRSI